MDMEEKISDDIAPSVEYQIIKSAIQGQVHDLLGGEVAPAVGVGELVGHDAVGARRPPGDEDPTRHRTA